MLSTCLGSEASIILRVISNIATAPPGVIKIPGDILSNLYYSSRCMHKKDGKLRLILSPLLVSDPNHLLKFAGHGGDMILYLAYGDYLHKIIITATEVSNFL